MAYPVSLKPARIDEVVDWEFANGCSEINLLDEKGNIVDMVISDNLVDNWIRQKKERLKAMQVV